MPEASVVWHKPSPFRGLLGKGKGQAQGVMNRIRPGEPTLYVVAYTHLDTQWRWEYPTVIEQYLPNTLSKNFELFARYPHYILNFSGANRYRMIKDYYRCDYAKLADVVARNRWFPCGSSVEESDVLVTGAESIFRQILYGNQFFRAEFGKASAEYMLPDSFGFPASLPSILAHAGIKGFSTQKLLMWKSGVGVPFNVGVWAGPDGRGVIAALNAGSYVVRVVENLSRSHVSLARILKNVTEGNLLLDYRYYGTGDIGGAPAEESVAMVEASAKSEGAVRVVPSTSEQMFLDITSDQMSRLPRYEGDLLLTEHSAGSITSQACMKAWNHRNECLADAAERASVIAEWLGNRAYPRRRLNDAWWLTLSTQFHDILGGTSTPKAYEYSWNDCALAMNQFTSIITSAVEAISSGMDTDVHGLALIVYNYLNIEREDIVEAEVTFPSGLPKAVRVVGPDGKEVPAQFTKGNGARVRVVFLAKVPPVGLAVYDVQAADLPSLFPELRISESMVENERYRISVDEDGNVDSIYDKRHKFELLSAPARLAFQTALPKEFPAWNMEWIDHRKPPRMYVGGPVKREIVEKGSARVILRLTRYAEGSRFVQAIRLATGDAGNRIEFANEIDWASKETALKAVFPLMVANSYATYNWEVSTILRHNNDESKFEVPSHQWFDLNDRSGARGVTVLSGSKFGSDKPDDATLRLTLLYTPGVSRKERNFGDQATQDWGHHEFSYGIATHGGDWRSEHTDWQAYRLDCPLIAFQAPKHHGILGRKLSFIQLSTQQARILAVKGAECTDDVIIRLVDTSGDIQPEVRTTFASAIISAREVDGQERTIGPVTVIAGQLVTSLTKYQIRSFAVKLAPPSRKLRATKWRPVRLTYEIPVTSEDGAKSVRGFDLAGRTIPAEMLPGKIDYAGIRFYLGPVAGGKANAIIAYGQKISLPLGNFSRLYLLAATCRGDQETSIRVGDRSYNLRVQSWSGFIGQWDRRIWRKALPELLDGPGCNPAGEECEPCLECIGITAGYIKNSPVAWFCSHRHTAEGLNDAYAYCYLFAYSVELPPGARTLTLPCNRSTRIMAITVSNEGGEIRPV